eukprot:6466143-Amphidinium_carterae.1
MGASDSRVQNNGMVQEKASSGLSLSVGSGPGGISHCYVETDGPDGYRVEHHKNGKGEYQKQQADSRKDGVLLREKRAHEGAEGRVEKRYKESAGHYGLLTDNCQHASQAAYAAADKPREPDDCTIL